MASCPIALAPWTWHDESESNGKAGAADLLRGMRTTARRLTSIRAPQVKGGTDEAYVYATGRSLSHEKSELDVCVPRPPHG